jgi:hypothetical protein
MIDSQVVFAAMAAVMHKDNHHILKRLQDSLIRQASGE